VKQKDLFSPKVIAKALSGKVVPIPAEHLSIIEDWQKKTAFGGKETNLDGLFLTEFWSGLLGYQGRNASGKWTIEKNWPVGAGNVDGALGFFTDKTANLLAPLELKGPKTKDLDAIMPGRHKTPVQQAWEYAMDARGAQWVLISNMLEIRLYAVGQGRQAYESFFLKDLHKPEEYARLKLLLSPKALLEGGAADLLKQSEQADKDITNELYKAYKTLRTNLIHALQGNNKGLAPEDAIKYAQTILDRVLFIAFAEDTLLLPKNSLVEAFTHDSDYDDKSVWQRFVKLFNWVDKGFPKRSIPPYNGGLFKKNPAIDRLIVPDDICEGFRNLGKYDFSSEISVNILGHIFEQSITDLEEMKALLAGEDFDAKKGKRKKDGVFYTPDYITRYIVEQAVGGWLNDRKKELGFYDLPALDPEKDYPQLQTGKKKSSKVRLQALTPKAKKHLAFWRAYKEALSHIKVVDPACGSGAFLVQVFDYLKEEGVRVNAEISRLQGDIIDIFERIDSSILKNNIYGVDLNPESVEITKLSLWLKTANNQEKLTSLDDNIKCGNSIVADDSVQSSAFDWKEQFAHILQSGGFDVVVGNPPYVRQELFTADKPYLQKAYATYHGVADLYVYFYEKGINLLKPNGWLGYISSGTFFKTSYGTALRRYLSGQASLKRLIDFGDVQVFEGATTYPTIVVLQKAKPIKGQEIAFTLVKEGPVDFATLEEHAATMPHVNLGESSWQLEKLDVAKIRQKIIGKNETLGEVYGSPLYGVKTGLNEAFVIDQVTRDQIIKETPATVELIKPFLEGKDFKTWRVEPRKLYLIRIKKGWTSNQSGFNDEAQAWEWLSSNYPLLAKHLLPFEAKARARSDKGEFWWELRACVYYGRFEGSKIVYGHFSVTPLFSMDEQGFYSNDKSYIISGGDWFLLSLLNSSAMWFLIKGMSPPVRGGFYECRIQYIETLPIPKADAKQKKALGDLAQQCQQAAEARYRAQQEVLQRIPDLAPNPATAKPSKKLQEWWELSFQEFMAEVKKTFKQPIPPEERNGWEKMLNTHRQQVNDLTTQIESLEQQINTQVYALFGLTADEIKIVEGK
jgi:type I restriction-modification system DNA methylase subunit